MILKTKKPTHDLAETTNLFDSLRKNEKLIKPLRRKLLEWSWYAEFLEQKVEQVKSVESEEIPPEIQEYLSKTGYELIHKRPVSWFVEADEENKGYYQHELKIAYEYFRDIRYNEKTFEIRKNDRVFKVGDRVLLREFEDDSYTGNEQGIVITYITDYEQKEDYVVFGFEKLEG